ncbi:hypothetical protein [Burkholderia sp.]|nr:hypothetical protein [Burkholderia sp.]MBS6361281.1 hypothetical protein [Burkholderia sp.]
MHCPFGRDGTLPVYEEGTRHTDLMHAYLPDHPGEGEQHVALARARTAG